MPNSILTPSLRLVVDTNVVMDMLFFHDIHTIPLRNAIQQGRMTCYVDGATLAELECVLTYPEFHLDAVSRKNLLQSYLGFVAHCEAAENEIYDLPRCRDGDDQKFLELAARCCAHMLVTRDKQLLRLSKHQHKYTSMSFAIVTATEASERAGLDTFGISVESSF